MHVLVRSLIVASFALASTQAWSQDATVPPTDPTTTTPPPPEAPPPPPPPPPPPAPPPKPAPVAPTRNRPADPWALGIGAGWFFPSDILVPNTASVRIAIPGAVTFEPFVNFALGGNDSVVENNEPDPLDASDSRS